MAWRERVREVWFAAERLLNDSGTGMDDITSSERIGVLSRAALGPKQPAALARLVLRWQQTLRTFLHGSSCPLILTIGLVTLVADIDWGWQWLATCGEFTTLMLLDADELLPWMRKYDLPSLLSTEDH